MIIKKIDIMIVSVPFDSNRVKSSSAEQDFNAASAEVSQMQSLLVKIETDNQLNGWGEGFGHLINPVTYQALKEVVGPFFLNKSFACIDDLKALMHQAELSFHAFGRTGPIRYALSAIDIALWDLLSKANQQPLWQFLGGKRDKIELYPSLVNYDDNVTGLYKTLQEVMDAGYREIKVHENKVSTIGLIREQLSDDIELSVDLNCILSFDQANDYFEKVRGFNLKWIEEPIWPPDNLENLAQIRTFGIPISAGENANGEIDFINFEKTHAVDYFQPSVAKIGGITAMLNLFEVAKNRKIKISPHCFYYGAGMLATAHLTTLLDDDVKLEVPFIKYNPIIHPLLKYQPIITLPTTPGLGFNPAPELINKIKIKSCSIE
ncbi:mandelate racemase/muconate lactonizing enzyme family protein [Celerinatantimonas sp. MCCC 1A17872]|uniref:mandelate racemase/muconate lactonizing enzyme family protein n=1 Tax=Celerinatantimonas sp. MCCC 1A17872 TaxID=3177514 RepID=UPI0038C9017C